MANVIRIKGGTDNCYLVAAGGEGSKAILVDTASAANFEQVAAVCDKYEVTLIVLTHVHFDHAENAARLAARYGVPVAIHESDEELFVSYDKQPLKSYGITGKVVLGMSLKVLAKTPVERPSEVIYVKEGDDLSGYGIDGKIIEMPGHTNGSIGVDVEGTHLIVGDALDNWVCPGVGHLYYDRDAIKRTGEKIRDLGERTIYYGHGNPTANGKFKAIK